MKSIEGIDELREAARAKLYLASDAKGKINISVTEKIPLFGLNHHGLDFRSFCVEFYAVQAEMLRKELKLLPQGTVDHLFAILAKEKATIFKIM